MCWVFSFVFLGVCRVPEGRAVRLRTDFSMGTPGKKRAMISRKNFTRSVAKGVLVKGGFSDFPKSYDFHGFQSIFLLNGAQIEATGLRLGGFILIFCEEYDGRHKCSPQCPGETPRSSPRGTFMPCFNLLGLGWSFGSRHRIPRKKLV